jgi:signal transduction histidine kinase
LPVYRVYRRGTDEQVSKASLTRAAAAYKLKFLVEIEPGHGGEAMMRYPFGTCAKVLQSLVLLCLLFGSSARAQAPAHDYITARAYHEDPSNAEPFPQVTAGAFTSYEGELSRGIYPGTVWMRLHLDGSAAAEMLLLRMAPNHIDTLELFDPARPSARPRLAGDRVDPGEYELPGLAYNFWVPRAPERDLWVRIKTSGPVNVQASALEPADHERFETWLAVTSSLFVAAQAALMLLALFNFIVHKDGLSGLYGLAQFSILISAMSRLGLMRMAFGSLLGTGLDAVSALSFFGAGLFGLAFGYRLLQQSVRSGWWFNLLRPFFPAWAVVYALYLAGSEDLALRFGIYLLFLGVAGLCVVAAVAKPLPADPVAPVPRWILFLTYLVLALFTMPSKTPVISVVLRAWEGPFSPIILSGLVGAGLLLALVVQRRRREDNQKKTLEVRAEAERSRRVEQSNFVAMLAHELKSPLFLIGVLADTNSRQAPVPAHLPAAAASAIEEMHAVIDKCVQATRVEDTGLTLATEECDVLALIHASSVHLSNERFRISVEDGADTWVYSDHAVLATILSNLMDNALKYSPPHSPIRVALRSAGVEGVPGLQVQVSNLPGAAGVPDAQRVFQKFYRSEGAARFRGSGLGLFISSKLAGLLGGRLELRRGAEEVGFVLWVPSGEDSAPLLARTGPQASNTI